MLLCEIKDIFGHDPVHFPIDSERFEELFEEPALKFLRLHHVDVYYVNDADRQLIQDRYQNRYTKLHFHRIPNRQNQSAKDTINTNNTTQLHVDSLTLASNQPLPTCHNMGEEHFNGEHSNEFITCFICSHQVQRNRLHSHYMSDIHQQILLNILLHLQKIKIENDNQQKRMKLVQAHNAISNTFNDASIINNNIQRIHNECRTHDTSLQTIRQQFNSLILQAEDNTSYLSNTSAILNTFGRELSLLNQNLEDRRVVSFDGTLLWKIIDVQQKIDDAIFERQRSIYSPEFFSSPTGYKMRSRLFLNGVDNSCGTHLSIYFILMRGNYDALLEWPFAFKVSFTLLDQSAFKDNKHHISDFFWSDIRSRCFERPRSEMNEAYGFEKFVSLEQIQQNQHRYVQNDTMLIKIEVDFTSKSSNKKPSSDSGRMLSNDERHTDTDDDELMRKGLFMLENSSSVQ